VTTTRATHLLVANPTAQSGKNAERIDAALALFARNGVACELLPTLPDGKTIDAVSLALARGVHTSVVAMGGDGTFREVGAALMASARRDEITMGMLPTGTANDQGRSFGIDAGDENMEANVAIILAAHETRLDAGMVETLGADEGPPTLATWFFDSAGWGMSARVLAARNEDRELVESIPIVRDVYRDQLVYAGALVRTFFESYAVDDTFDARIIADGVEHVLEGITDLVVKGTRIYGGAWVLDRSSSHDDGLFEVVPFHGKADWLARAIVDLEGNAVTEAVLREMGVEHATPLRASKLEMRFSTRVSGAEGAASSPLSAQIDGEEHFASAHVRITVVPRALRLVVPRPTST
jgi:diacylglycerol kinase family enzyme